MADTSLLREPPQAREGMLVEAGLLEAAQLGVDAPVMVINTRDKAFDIFCREHRGINGFGSIVTPA